MKTAHQISNLGFLNEFDSDGEDLYMQIILACLRKIRKTGYSSEKTSSFSHTKTGAAYCPVGQTTFLDECAMVRGSVSLTPKPLSIIQKALSTLWVILYASKERDKFIGKSCKTNNEKLAFCWIFRRRRCGQRDIIKIRWSRL